MPATLAVTEICPAFPDAVEPPSIQFPGGITLEAGSAGDDYPTALGLTTNLLSQAGPVMGGLAPFFTLLDVVIKLFETVKAIPDSILSLNPQPLIEAIQELTQAVAEVVKLIPQLSLPVMIVGLIDTIIIFLEGLVPELVALGELQTKADGIRSAGEDEGIQRLIDFADCLDADVASQTDALSKSLGPVGQIIEVMNILLSLAGLPAIPGIGDFSDPAGGATLLADFVEVLSAIRDTIPV